MKDYIYSVARVRARQALLLSKQDLLQLIDAKSYSDALSLLRDKGYKKSDNASPIHTQEKELWDFAGELADKDVTRVLRLSADYHNIKASAKSVFLGKEPEGLLISGGTLEKEQIYNAIKTREFHTLPGMFGRTAEGAMSILLKTQDGQLCDIYVDRAELAAVEQAAYDSGDPFIIRYAKMNTDTANLSCALRCAFMHKSREFISNAIYRGGTINTNALINAAADGVERLCSFVENTPFKTDAAVMKRSAAEFGSRCDNRLIRLMTTARYESFSAAPILAYVYAKKTEIAVVRLILSAKRNGFDNEIIKERMEQLYVQGGNNR